MQTKPKDHSWLNLMEATRQGVLDGEFLILNEDGSGRFMGKNAACKMLRRQTQNTYYRQPIFCLGNLCFSKAHAYKMIIQDKKNRQDTDINKSRRQLTNQLPESTTYRRACLSKMEQKKRKRKKSKKNNKFK